MPVPLPIVQIAILGTIGGNIYRVHQPCAALARLPCVEVFEVHAPLCSQRQTLFTDGSDQA